jgi:hypothetical protein
VAVLMAVIMRWSRKNLKQNPGLIDEIGRHGHGTAL